MSKQTNYINSDLTEGVLTLTLNDPSTKNAMGLEMANELLQALSEFSKDSQSRVILIRFGKAMHNSIIFKQN